MIINTDAIEYMETVPDRSFDMVITSPPYNMNIRVNSKGDGYCSWQVVKHEFASKYASYADNMPMNDYENFLNKTILECCRIARITFLNIQSVTGNKPALDV